MPVCEHTHLPRVQAAASNLSLVQRPPPADCPHDLPSWHDKEKRAPPEGFLPETDPDHTNYPIIGSAEERTQRVRSAKPRMGRLLREE